jgi:hypothetical protein
MRLDEVKTFKDLNQVLKEQAGLMITGGVLSDGRKVLPGGKVEEKVGSEEKDK